MCAGGSWQEMDLLLLSQIDEELESSEVAELCFLCSDVLNRKRLEGVRIIKHLQLSGVFEQTLWETGRQHAAFYSTPVHSSLDMLFVVSLLKMSHCVFVNCTYIDHGCKGAVPETGGEKAAGELLFPRSVASHYPSSRSPQHAEH